MSVPARSYIALVVARTIPLFPLPVVLFPGVALPLHIFEPRYRRMLSDCLEGDRRFGLIHLPESTPERDLPRGQVGCIARVESVEPLPDGRSNIVVAGEERFALERFVDDPRPYHLGEVRDYADLPEPDEPLHALADGVLERFTRVAAAARALGNDHTPPPALPPGPALLAFRIAALVDTPLTMRYHLLASRSPLGRLREIDRLLASVEGGLQRRAELHERAKGNGRARGGPPGTAP